MWASVLGAAGLGRLVGENVEENLAFVEGVEEAQKQEFGENDSWWIRFGYHFGNAVAQEEGMRAGDGYRTLYSMRKSAQASSNIVRKTPSLMSDMWRGNTLNSSRLENYASDWGNFSLGVISNLGAISGLGSGKGRVTAQPSYTQTHLNHNPFSSLNSVPHLHNYSGVLTSANRNLPFANSNRMVIPQQSVLTGTGNSTSPSWLTLNLNNSISHSNTVMSLGGNSGNKYNLNVGVVTSSSSGNNQDINHNLKTSYLYPKVKGQDTSAPPNSNKVVATYNSNQLNLIKVESQDLTQFRQALASSEQPLMGEYRTVRGHHVHAKKAFEGHPNYDPKKGFSISKKLMDELKIDHDKVTVSQKKLFTELVNNGRSNTLQEHTRIAVEALIKGGCKSEEIARTIVAQSLKSLRNANVKAPTTMPWYPSYNGGN